MPVVGRPNSDSTATNLSTTRCLTKLSGESVLSSLDKIFATARCGAPRHRYEAGFKFSRLACPVMDSDIESTFVQIYRHGFMVPPVSEQAFGTGPTDPEYPSEHLLVTSTHSPKDTYQDLERLRAVGLLEMKKIDGQKMYVLTEQGIKVAHDRETHNRQIELEKRRAKRQRELNKGVGMVSFALVAVTLSSIILNDMRTRTPGWVTELITVLYIVFLLAVGGSLLWSFYRADTVGWKNI